LRSAAIARGDILARRRTGDEQPDDGEVVALLDLDGDGLRTLLAEAQVVVMARRGPVAEASTLISHAQAMLQRSEDGSVLAALMNRADALSVELEEALVRMDEVRQRTGDRHVWRPTLSFYRAVRHCASRHKLL
jgi:hypothetical protein